MIKKENQENYSFSGFILPKKKQQSDNLLKKNKKKTGWYQIWSRVVFIIFSRNFDPDVPFLTLKST